MDYMYILAPVELAERAGLKGMRQETGNQVILNESDMRMVDMTIAEKVEYFGCTPIGEEQALILINQQKEKENEEIVPQNNEGLEVPDAGIQGMAEDSESGEGKVYE